MAKIRKRELINDHPVMKWTGFAILMLYTVTILFALVWALISALKDFYEFRKNLFGLPQTWMFSNLKLAFENLFVPVEGREYTLIYLIGISLAYAFLYTVIPVFAKIGRAHV